MKNILIISALFALAAVSAQAQGTIKFNNSSTTKITTNLVVGGAAFGATGTAISGPQDRYALFYSTTATSVNGQTGAILGGASVNYWQAIADTYGPRVAVLVGGLAALVAAGWGVLAFRRRRGSMAADRPRPEPDDVQIPEPA